MGIDYPVAVLALTCDGLAGELAKLRLPGLASVGRLVNENIGLVRIIRFLLRRTEIRYLILAGQESKQRSGARLLALTGNASLSGLSDGELAEFIRQVEVVDLIGCEDINLISEKTAVLLEKSCHSSGQERVKTVPRIKADHTLKFEQDPLGYFIITPMLTQKKIVVEHYDYNHKRLRIIEGCDALTIYSTIIEQSLISLMAHAAYLGRELARAEFAMSEGYEYIQDTGCRIIGTEGETN